MQTERRLFLTFHRQVFCEVDKFVDLTMEDIRKIEDETKKALDEVRMTFVKLETIWLLKVVKGIFVREHRV